jgi:hypothetical protein
MGYVSKWPRHGYALCFEDCFILRSQTLNYLNCLCFELVLLIELCFSGLVKLGFSGLCFEWGSMFEFQWVMFQSDLDMDMFHVLEIVLLCGPKL